MGFLEYFIVSMVNNTKRNVDNFPYFTAFGIFYCYSVSCPLLYFNSNNISVKSFFSPCKFQ